MMVTPMKGITHISASINMILVMVLLQLDAQSSSALAHEAYFPPIPNKLSSNSHSQSSPHLLLLCGADPVFIWPQSLHLQTWTM